MCHAGLSNQGRSSSTATAASNDCKWGFTEAFLTPWCHAVVGEDEPFFNQVTVRERCLPRQNCFNCAPPPPPRRHTFKSLPH